MESSTNNLKHKFGKRLTSLRIRKSLTQEQLAEATGISVDFISLVERGLRAPSFRTLERLAAVLDVDVKELFNFDSKDEC